MPPCHQGFLTLLPRIAFSPLCRWPVGETVLRWDGAKLATEMTDEGGDLTKVNKYPGLPEGMLSVSGKRWVGGWVGAPAGASFPALCPHHTTLAPPHSALCLRQARRELDRYLDFRGNTLFASTMGGWEPAVDLWQGPDLAAG